MTGNINLQDIASAPAEPIGKSLSTEKKGFNPITGAPDRYSQELGWLGKFCGGAQEKAGNIALFVAFLSFLIILFGFIVYIECTDNNRLGTISTFITSGFTMMSGALGYIFGSSKSKE